jgi:hypothetical protein
VKWQDLVGDLVATIATEGLAGFKNTRGTLSTEYSSKFAIPSVFQVW